MMFAFNNLLYLVALFIFGILISIIIIPSRKKTKINVLTIFIISFLGRSSLIFINESLDILPSREAGNMALNIFNSAYLPNNAFFFINDDFGIQVLLNIPAFALFGANRINLLLTNAFLASLVGIIAFSYLYYCYTLKGAYFSLILITIFPASIIYSIFGLRDPVIYFFSVIYICSLIFLVKNNRVTSKFWMYNLLILFLSLFAIFSLRISLFPLALTIPLLYSARYLYGKLKKVRNRATQGLIFMLFIFLNIGILLGPGIKIYSLALSGMGVSKTVSPLQLSEVYAEQRYERHAGEEGGGSHILPPSIYNNTNALTRIPIQTIGLIWLPVPWLLTSPTRILAFIDSLVIMYCLLIVYKYRKFSRNWPTSDRILWWFIFIAFVVAILGLGLIVSNAGNAFRMRLAVAPYLLIPTAIMLGNLNNRKRRKPIDP